MKIHIAWITAVAFICIALGMQSGTNIERWEYGEIRIREVKVDESSRVTNLFVCTWPSGIIEGGAVSTMEQDDLVVESKFKMISDDETSETLARACGFHGVFESYGGSRIWETERNIVTGIASDSVIETMCLEGWCPFSVNESVADQTNGYIKKNVIYLRRKVSE